MSKVNKIQTESENGKSYDTSQEKNHCSSLRPNKSTFCLWVEVSWSFQEFTICVVLNLPVFNLVLHLTPYPIGRQNTMDLKSSRIAQFLSNIPVAFLITMYFNCFEPWLGLMCTYMCAFAPYRCKLVHMCTIKTYVHLHTHIHVHA